MLEYVLKSIYDAKNYIAVVSDCPQRHETLLQEIYDESGLRIAEYEKPLTEKLEADIIINLHGFPHRFHEQMLARSIQVPIDLELLAQIIYKQSIDFRRFVKGQPDKMNRSNIEHLLEEYGIEFYNYS